MTYHLKPVRRFRTLEPSYEGLHLGTHRIRLTQRFAARLTGVLRVQVSYDTRARVICIAPLKVKKGPAGADAFRISRNARSTAFIHCTTLHAVMSQGRYRFVEHTSEGYICQHDPAKPAGKR
ncbi:MAG TPA: hypothetical protein VGC99_26060 [Candidatus Tectomicrobia bacterium]